MRKWWGGRSHFQEIYFWRCLGTVWPCMTPQWTGGGSRPPWTPPGKRLRRYAYGLDRTNRCPKLTSKRHTELRSCVSETKFVKESDSDVKSRLAPPKSTEIDEKHDSDTEKFSNFNFAKAGAPPVPSRTAVRPGPSLGKIKICQVFRTNEQTTNEQK